MASTKHTLYLAFILAAFITASRADIREVKETSMTMYFQDQFGGPNPTVKQIIPQNPDGHLSFAKFGAIFCTDDQMTEEFEATSAELARAQGVYITSALDGSNTHVLVSIVFNNGAYEGSTLEVQGASAQFEKVREVAVVGGTGKFRFARGFATLETVHVDFAASLAVIQCNITVQHY